MSIKLKNHVSKYELYQTAVNILQNDDRNGTYDEILQDAEYDLDYAYDILISCLERAIEEIDDKIETALYILVLDFLNKGKKEYDSYKPF